MFVPIQPSAVQGGIIRPNPLSMNASQLFTSSPSTVTHCFHTSQIFPLRLSRGSLSRHKRRRLRLSLTSTLSSPFPPDSAPPTSLFGDKRKLNGFQLLIESLPKEVRVAGSVIIAAAAFAAGYSLGLRFTANKNLALVGAVAAGAAGVAAVYSLNSSAPEVAAAALHNLATEFDDPKDLRTEDIDNIARKYGVSKTDEAFVAELRDIYCRFVSSVLPPVAIGLQGNEAEAIVNFKSTLGIDDVDAAAMHMEIGRRIVRERLETGDRESDAEQHRAFQKLIYVSDLVFGKASAFLLPWKRVFKITDSQIELAIRDNAQRVYAFTLKSIGQDVNEEQLIYLRQAQLRFKLADEVAIDLFRRRMGVIIENNVISALDTLKSSASSGEGLRKVVLELEKILFLNYKLISFSKLPESSSFARGVGPVSLISDGNDRKMDDLKLMYSVYVTDALSGGHVEESKVDGFTHLRKIFGLGKQEAEGIINDITSKMYRRCLAQAVSSGELDAATSKAACLQGLCEKLRFDPEKATRVHEEIYKQKLRQCVANGELNEDDAAALNRVRVSLCIPHLTVEAIHADICGSLFEKAVNDAISSGVEGFSEARRKSVIKSLLALRLTEELAMSIANKAILKTMTLYIKRSIGFKKRAQTADDVMKMLSFYSLVVTPLISDIKAEFPDSATDAEPDADADIETEIDEKWRNLETLRKAKEAELLSPVQPGVKIDLKTEVPLDDRMELYKKYLLHCISGKVVTLPFGAELPIKSDSTEYIHLNRLARLLCLSVPEVVEVHRGVAERAFQKKAQSLLSDGQITKAKLEQLNEFQQSLGLPQEFADGVVKSITSTKMATVLQNALDRGSLNLNQVREMREASVDLNSLVSERLREEIFKKAIDDMFSSGTGEFDAVEVYEKITSDLDINKEKAKAVVDDVARRRLANSLVQAVAMLRRRDHNGVVMAVNDLLACDKAVPSEPLVWDRAPELGDVFASYASSDPPAENLARLQYLFGLSDAAVAGIMDSVKAAKENVMFLGAEEENFVF